MTADSAGERKFLEELFHPRLVFSFIWIDLGIGPLEIRGPEDAGRAVSGARHQDRVQVVLIDQPVEMDVDKAEARTRAPVAEKTLLDMLDLQRLAQQRIGAQVDHAGGQVIARAPVSMNFAQLFGGKPLRRLWDSGVNGVGFRSN